jgi:hypothetical protein
MARPSRGRRTVTAEREARETRGAIIKIAAVVFVVGAFAALYLTVASKNRRLDPVTLCPADPASVTVLLVDVTDPMNAAQRQDFMNQLVRLKNSIPRYGQLIVTKVDATSGRLLAPVITRCNPGTAADVSDATGNPAAVQKRWDEGFDKPLQAAFDALAVANGAEQSPILESIQSVNLTELQRPGSESRPKKLVVVSDLLQNTPQISFYGRLPDAGEFVSSAAFRRVRTDLKSVDVELWMLERADASSTQPRALADLWDQIVTAQNGTLRRVYNVSG